MGKKFTDAQLSAIQDRGNNLLVSAAAGSGKTTVLIERIIRRITDPNDSINIDDLLVVTYTKSAAAEIREKLSNALAKKIAENPSDRKLMRQLAMLGNAHINTIDAFFLDVIKNNSEKLGLPQNISPCDKATSDSLMQKSCDEILEKFYADKNPAFYKFVENFSKMRDDENVASFIIELYEELRKHPEPFEYLKVSINQYDFVASGGDYMESVWGKKLSAELYEITDGILSLCENVFDIIGGSEKSTEKFGPAVTSIKNCYTALQNALKTKNYNNVRNALNSYEKAKIGGQRGIDESENSYVTGFRDDAEKKLNEAKLFFGQSESDIKRIATESKELLETAYEILRKFDSVYSAKKRQLGVIDFADMPEKYFSLLFERKDGKLVLSEFAKNAASDFKEIYIDEYQDTNIMRDMIFEAVSKVTGATRFMVGDVKQCIYAFNDSRPELFMKYYDSFARTDGCKRIILSENFRSDLSIVKTVNTVFSPIMTRKCGGVDYDKDAELVYKKPDGGDEKAELLLLAVGHGDNIAVQRILQAKMIANKIAELINSGKYKPSDFAIIVRTNKEFAPYLNALSELGIKASSARESFFELSEITLLLSVLSAIDNPNSDIPLFAAMTSPIFGFSANDTAKLALKSSGESLWNYVCRNAESDGKLAKFVKKMNEYRSFSLSFGIDKLIIKICRDSGFERLVKAKENGQSRYKAIMKLCKYAREYSCDDYRGIESFLSYMKRLKAPGNSENDAATCADGVTVCTVHASKGLEYEVCFVANLERSVKGNNKNTCLFMTPELPPSFDIRHPSGFATIASPMCKSAKAFRENDSITEEMRVLYVALTRARKKLYITASIKEDVLSDTTEKFKFDKDICNPFAIENSGSCIEWVLRSLCKRFSVQAFDSALYGKEKLCDYLDISLVTAEYANTPVVLCQKEQDKATVNIEPEYEYRGKARTEIPAKLSVSELSDSDEEPAYAKPSGIYTTPAAVRPEFMPESSAGGAEKGIAMHQFMQFCDFEKASKDISVEAERLVENGFITAKQRELLDEKLLAKFFESGLYAKIKNSESVYREFRYNLCEDSSEYYDVKGEKILVQGVIDCFFEEKDGSVTLLDFKTDRVFPQNGKAELIKRYSAQLSYYRKAVESILEKKVAHTYIYSFSLSCEIEI